MRTFAEFCGRQKRPLSSDGDEAKVSRGELIETHEEPLEPQDSATDPAILAAILESLRTAHADGTPALSATTHFLCRNLSGADPAVAGQLRQQRAARLLTSPGGVTHFDHPEDDPLLVLPSFEGHTPEVRSQVLGQLCNDYLLEQAEEAGVINCVPGCTPLWVLNTQGDGNCLSHAASLGVFGVHDRDSQLREAIHATMAHPVAGQEIRQRFEMQLQQNMIPEEEWAAEWRRELSAFNTSARMSDRYLSDVHCFVLANVLRRPLLLYGDESAAAAGLMGVYLPLLWSPAACCTEPVAVLFWGSHFSLLVTVEGEGPAEPPLLPLCTRGGLLQVRFLSASELQQHGSNPLALLQTYMACEELPNNSQYQQQQDNQEQRQGQAGHQLQPQLAGACGSFSRTEAGLPKALGVRLSGARARQGLVQLLEVAFVSQAAALCGGSSEGRRRSRRLSSGLAGSRRSLQGDQSEESQQALVA